MNMKNGQANGPLPSSQQADPKQRKRVMRALVLWTILFYLSIVLVIALSGLGFMYSAKWMVWHTVNIMNGLLILVVPCFVLLAGLVLGNKWIVQNVLAVAGCFWSSCYLPKPPRDCTQTVALPCFSLISPLPPKTFLFPMDKNGTFFTNKE